MFLKKEQSQNEPYQTNQPELQQDFFRPVSEFSTKKFPNYDLSEFCYKRDRKFKKCLFSSQFHSFGVELYHNSKVLYRFYAKYAKISSNYLEMSTFPFRNFQYTRYQDQTWKKIWIVLK